MADVVIDTSDMRPMELKVRISEIFAGVPLGESVFVDVFSFGYKYGAPIDADIVFDVRFIPNPFYVDELKALNRPGSQGRRLRAALAGDAALPRAVYQAHPRLAAQLRP